MWNSISLVIYTHEPISDEQHTITSIITRTNTLMHRNRYYIDRSDYDILSILCKLRHPIILNINTELAGIKEVLA